MSWAPCSILYTPTTACPLTAPLLSLNLLMILLFWASLTTMRRPHTWMRWRDSHHGARTTISLWTWAKLKSWSWTSGRDSSGPTTPLMISGTPVKRVTSFKYLGVNISEDLTWTTHIQTQVKKARQRLYHLRQLRKFRVSPTILKTFYSGAIESVFCMVAKTERLRRSFFPQAIRLLNANPVS